MIDENEPLMKMFHEMQEIASRLVKSIDAQDSQLIKKDILRLKKLGKDVEVSIKDRDDLTEDEIKGIELAMSEIEAVLLSEEKELKRFYYDRLRIMSGNGEQVMKDTMARIESVNKNALDHPLQHLQTGDIIGNSNFDYGEKWGMATRVFMRVTHSKFSHVGIVHVKRNWRGKKKMFVIEATPPIVKEGSFENYVATHEGKIAVYRYRNGLNKDQKKKMIKHAYQWIKKWNRWWTREVEYDFNLMPGDEALYCSELVDEVYKAIGITLSEQYYSVSDVHESAKELFIKGALGKQYNSWQEAIGEVWGKKGYYNKPDPQKIDLYRKYIIPPELVLKNPNTINIFDTIG